MKWPFTKAEPEGEKTLEELTVECLKNAIPRPPDEIEYFATERADGWRVFCRYVSHEGDCVDGFTPHVFITDYGAAPTLERAREFVKTLVERNGVYNTVPLP